MKCIITAAILLFYEVLQLKGIVPEIPEGSLVLVICVGKNNETYILGTELDMRLKSK